MSVTTTSAIINKSFSGLKWLEKADSGKVTLEDIGDALEEFARLFKAGISSKAETLTLARAFPNNRQYTEAAGNVGDDDPMVVGGPASVSLIDREGHLITTDALKKAFDKFMGNFRTRNAMVLHSDVQVGWALPAYITRGGQIFKSGVDDKGLFFICELRDDTKISEKVKKEIDEGRLRSYSIAGSALKVQNMQKGLVPYMQVDEMELAEVTVCEKGVNQSASFELLKAEMPQTGQIDKDQCGYRDATPEESARGIDCGHCKYFNAEDKSCDVVSGHILPGDYCKIFAPMASKPTKVVVVMRNKENVDFKKSFDMWLAKAETVKDPLKSKESLAVLDNFAGREAEHHQLLREYGFPSEQPSESSRYVPVIETETDDKGVPRHIKPPWIVNEAGQDLGDKHDEDSPEYHKSDKAKNRKKAKAVQKMGFLFKAPGDDLRETYSRRRSGSPDPVPEGQSAADRYETTRRQEAKDKREAESKAVADRYKSGVQSGGKKIPTPKEIQEQSRQASQRHRDERAAARPQYVRPSEVARSGWGDAPIPEDTPKPSAPKRPGFRERLGEIFSGVRGGVEGTPASRRKAKRQGRRGPSTTDAEGNVQSGKRGPILSRGESRESKPTQAGRTVGEGIRRVGRGGRGAFKGFFKPRADQPGAGRGGERGVGAGTEGTAQRMGTSISPFRTRTPEQRQAASEQRQADDKQRRTGKYLEGLKRQSGKDEKVVADRDRTTERGQTSYLDRLKSRSLKEERKADYSHQAGGQEGNKMTYDEHDTAFKDYHDKMGQTGRATVREHLDALDRFGHTTDRKRLFNVKRGGLSEEDLDKDIHVHEFANMLQQGTNRLGQNKFMETHDDYKQHKDAITGTGTKGAMNPMAEGGSLLHNYSNHLFNYAAEDAPSAYSSSKTQAQPQQQVAMTTPKPAGAFGPAPTPKEQNPVLFPKSVKKAAIDKMLMKAMWGGK